MDTGGSSWSGVVNWMTSSYISTSGTLLRVLIVKEECRAAIIAVAANAMSRVGGSVSNALARWQGGQIWEWDIAKIANGGRRQCGGETNAVKVLAYSKCRL